MNPLSIDAFCAWLCEHETDLLGEAGRCYSSPLARWLSLVCGYTCGADNASYGRASHLWWQWRPLPFWARALSYRLEQQGYRPMTGLEVLAVLADIELTLCPSHVR